MPKLTGFNLIFLYIRAHTEHHSSFFYYYLLFNLLQMIFPLGL